MASFWDSPLVSSVAFHPRQHPIRQGLPRNAVDGVFEEALVSLGYRFFRPSPPDTYRRTMLLFHGNAEIAADYSSTADRLAAMNPPTALIVVDYRGYGWSSGQPSVSTLLDDAEVIERQLRALGLNADTPVFLYGRSIGSVCAMHLAHKFPHRFHGLIIESGFHSILELPMVQQMAMFLPGGSSMLQMLPEIFHCLDKIKAIHMPVLFLHGEVDDIAPVQQCRDLFRACGSTQKKLHVFPHAGHNDLILRHETAYVAAMAALMDKGSAQVDDPHDHLHRQACCSPPPLTSMRTMTSTLLSLYKQKEYQCVLEQVQGLTTTPSDSTRFRDVNAQSFAHAPIESKKIVFEVGAKASWHVKDWVNVIRFTSDVLSVDPKDVNALTLRAKAHLECNDVASAQADALVLGTTLLQTTASSTSSTSSSSYSSSSSNSRSSPKASLAMALMAIFFWNVQ